MRRRRLAAGRGARQVQALAAGARPTGMGAQRLCTSRLCRLQMQVVLKQHGLSPPARVGCKAAPPRDGRWCLL